jgi:chromosomal replication initiation ATPase DnaA
LAAVLAKQFADRQLRPSAGLIPHLLTRMPRSFAAAARLVALLDAEALARRQRLTIPLARPLLDKFDPDGA